MMLTGCHGAKDQTSWLPCCRSSHARGGYVPDQACGSGVAANKLLPAASYTTFKYDNFQLYIVFKYVISGAPTRRLRKKRLRVPLLRSWQNAGMVDVKVTTFMALDKVDGCTP